MKVFGTIIAPNGSPPVVHEQWVEVCKTHPSLVSMQPVMRPNPFKPGQMMTVRAPIDTVHVVVSGRDCGWMEWAQDGSPLINVWGDDRTIIPVAEEIASILSARFIEEVSYPGDDLN